MCLSLVIVSASILLFESRLTLRVVVDLSQRQRLVVKYIELVNEFDTDNLYTDEGLFVLLRGRATVSCRGQSLIINAKPGCDIEVWNI